MRRPRIVVVGSINVDMVVKARRIPAPGETVTGGAFTMSAGGKGANQAVAAARLGAEVTLIGMVGRDSFGDQSRENYEREGIRTDRIGVDTVHPTGVALIMVDEQGENLISVASGANHALTEAQVESAAEEITAADIVMLQLEIPMGVVARTVQLAAGAGVPVILNPAPAAPLPDGLWGGVTYLTPNEAEAAQLTGIAVGDEASAGRAAQRLLDRGARHVIVTLGAKGALLAAEPGQAVLIPSPRVTAIDSTAAGDAFNAALAWALGSGLPLAEAVRRACLVGALSVTRLGAQPSLPTRDELDRFAESL
jgi:ribokinase